MQNLLSARVGAKRIRVVFLAFLLLFLAACGRPLEVENPLETDANFESQAVWTKIADEYKSFTLSGTQTVRYGTEDRWVEKSVTDEGYCGNRFFGSDPAKGTLKQCEVLALATPNAPAPTPGPTGPSTTVNFQKDNSNFLNPERGFSTPQVSYSDSPKALSDDKLEQSKSQGISVINRRYAMVTFRNRDISQSYLNHIQSDLDLVRRHGMKMVIRFSYTFNESGSHADAPLSRILSHVEQLRPILQRNADVIAYLEAGFIGRWGEWNKSSNGLGDESNPQNVNAQRQLVEALLEALPEERMITLRYLSRKKAILSDSPLRPQQAYDGSNQARTGHMNDYFTIDNWSGRDRTYLSQDTLYTVQGGEPIRLNGRRSECAAVMDELETFHWSTMNVPGSSFSNLWRNGGCYDSIAKRLGYRYFLSKATLPQGVTPGSPLSVTLTMTNEGFANLYNPRDVELILRNENNDEETRLTVDLEQDLRLVLPGAGETKDLTFAANVPNELSEGEYDLFVNLPDPSSDLKDRAAYSIRLANSDTWESETGYNKLGSVTIE
jgi:Domain of unknown function (DUF4832)/Domain of unknown function (DUF4874)